MTKTKLALTFFGLLLVVCVIAGIKFLQISTLISLGENFVEPPTTVSSVQVESYEWESTLTAIGSLEAAKGLVVTADLSGRITKINFDAGSEVKAGDLLIEQDTSVEKAQLRAAKSAVALAKNNFDRTAKLFKRKVASKSEYDNANSNYKSALAEADNIRAAIEKKSIRAPFGGRLGIRLVNLGQSIDAGQPVVSLQAADRMFVNFFLPQQNLPKLSAGLTIRLTTDAVPGKQFTGKINAINPEIDTDTRSVEIQAILANPENELLPGMFASLEVILPHVETVLLIPNTAIQYATYGDSVFVLETKSVSEEASESDSADGSHEVAQEEALSEITTETEVPPSSGLIARQQFIRLGQTRGDYVVVTKGLSKGEQIASMGVFKLRNGAPVIINNTVVPDFSLAPSVKDQ